MQHYIIDVQFCLESLLSYSGVKTGEIENNCISEIIWREWKILFSNKCESVIILKIWIYSQW